MSPASPVSSSLLTIPAQPSLPAYHAFQKNIGSEASTTCFWVRVRVRVRVSVMVRVRVSVSVRIRVRVRVSVMVSVSVSVSSSVSVQLTEILVRNMRGLRVRRCLRLELGLGAG